MRVTFISLVILIAVSCVDKPKHNFQVVEDARLQAKENALMLAKQFRAENKMAEWDIYARGDSTISSTCPQGDGWASMELRDPNFHSEAIKLKCSTVSLGIGCMTADDFKNKVYANQEGKCNPDIPHPLPKIVN